MHYPICDVSCDKQHEIGKEACKEANGCKRVPFRSAATHFWTGLSLISNTANRKSNIINAMVEICDIRDSFPSVRACAAREALLFIAAAERSMADSACSAACFER
jgi:hypothetical protein